MQRITFNTLAYSKKLSEANIINGDVFAEALTEVLKETAYNTYEVDKMIEDTFKWFNERTVKMQQEFHQEMTQRKEEFFALENRIEKTFNRYFVATIATLSTVIVAVVTIASILLHFNFAH